MSLWKTGHLSPTFAKKSRKELAELDDLDIIKLKFNTLLELRDKVHALASKPINF